MTNKIFQNVGYKEIKLRNKIIKCGWKYKANILKVNAILKKYHLNVLSSYEMLAYITQDNISYYVLNYLYPELSDFGLSDEKINIINQCKFNLLYCILVSLLLMFFVENIQTNYSYIPFLIRIFVFTALTVCICDWYINEDIRKSLKMYQQVTKEYKAIANNVWESKKQKEIQEAKIRDQQRRINELEEQKRQEILRLKRIQEEENRRLIEENIMKEKQKRQEIMRIQKIEEERVNKKRNRDFWYKLNPYVFEEKIGELFKDLGYEVTITPKSRDGGVDIVVQKDANITAVQCKRYKGKVVEREVRDLWGAKDYIKTSKKIMKADSAIMVALSGVTQEAEDFIKHFPKYELWTIEDILEKSNQSYINYQNNKYKHDYTQNNSIVIEINNLNRNDNSIGHIRESYILNGQYITY